ncbi:MAG TPA: dihydrodipicolinate synthase family protein [Methylomirabilota bacterium]|jgi:4-hydroxy-tetrahydrodipicolinate synthase|nr:dihydrodipicolinate synthase family protein [Methylomirabilota bacterium]
MGPLWSWDTALSGVIPPLISPLAASGDPDAAAMGRLVQHVLAGGASGLFVLGGCGEGAWLTTAQRGAVVRAAHRAAAGRVPVLVGVMLPATGPAAEAARQAAGEGADAIVLGSPYYFPVDAATQRRHVEAVMAATSLPALLYNIPQSTHHTLAPDTVAALAREPRVLGIKDSAGDFETFLVLLAVKRARSDFRVLQGNESLAAASLLQGADGLVPGLANVAPALFVALRAAAARGDAVACRSLQAEIAELVAVYRQGPWLAALKAACALLGIGNGLPAAPLAAADEAQRRALAPLVRPYGESGTRPATAHVS